MSRIRPFVCIGGLLLAGCVRATYPGPDGKPTTITAVGYDFALPANPPVQFKANEHVADVVGNTVSKLSADTVNHFADKAAEANSRSAPN
jgi:hypothetical protein